MNCTLVSIKEIPQKSLLKDFDCGIDELNVFLARYALKNDALGIGKTFVAMNENKLLGYFTLATAQIAFDDISSAYQSKLPKYPIPSLRIARLAVHKKIQGNHIGKFLLAEAFKKIIAVSEVVGIKFIIVDAKDSSKEFYEHYGFIKMNDKNLTYFIPLETVKKAL